MLALMALGDRMRMAFLALAVLLVAAGCDGGDDEGNPCRLGGNTGAEFWRDGQKVEVLASATASKVMGMKDSQPVWVEKVTVALEIAKYPTPTDKDECVQKLTIAVSNPVVGKAEVDGMPENGEMTVTATYGWDNANQDSWLDNVHSHLSNESEVVIKEYADGYISGTFRLVWKADPLTKTEGVVLEDGSFKHVPVTGP